MCNSNKTAETIHAFEKAGLGLAPFKFLGLETTSDRAALNKEREANGGMFTTNLCGGSCDFCGQAIFNVYRLESADGKKFKVGCDCIRKSGDAGLIRIVKDEESQVRREKTKAKRKAKWERENDLVDAFRSGKCEALRNQPHPKGREGATAYDYCEWCINNRMVGAVVFKLISSCL